MFISAVNTGDETLPKILYPPVAFLMITFSVIIAIINLNKKEPLTPENETNRNVTLPGNVPDIFYCFIGRTKTLSQIHKEFRLENTDSSSRILVIHGLGGVGKSDIAKKYAIEYQKDYNRIRWIDAETGEGIRYGYTKFAKEYGLDQGVEKAEDIIKEVMKWMKNHDQWLFIFDNANDKASIAEYLPELNTGNILITSRSSQWEEFEQIEIKGLDKSEACDFLKAYTKQDKDDSLENLVEELGCFPLALRHAGAYMKKTKTNSSDFLKEFRKNKPKKSPGYANRDTQIVAETLETSIKLIREKASRQLLYLCAFMAPKDIKRQWFADVSEKLPDPLRKVVKEKSRYDDAIAELTACSLITLDREGNLGIQRVVQEIIRDSLKRKQANWRNNCVEILNKLRYTDFSTIEARTRFSTLVSHIISVTDKINEKDESEETANLYHFLGYGFYEYADYPQALEYNLKAMAIREKVLGKDHPSTGTTYNNIAGVYKAKGEYDRALDWYLKAIPVLVKVLGFEHPNTNTGFSNMTTAYKKSGKPESFEEWVNKKLRIEN